MKRRHIALISSISLSVTVLLALGTANGFFKNTLFTHADNNPYVLDMTRSVNSSELSAGQVVYNTNNDNPISFKFDSLKAETNNNGVLNLLTGGYFYNDTAITGINKIDVTLSGGSATLTYGNEKDNLTLGSETLNTSGNDDVVFNVNLASPSNYFKLDVASGPSLLKRLKVTYSCVNSAAKTPLTILFQGDSITDNSRSRTNLDDLGGGYAAMVADALNETYGNVYDFTFINRAHSGWNLIEDWNAGGVNHYQEEFYQYNPDIATILIGYNDIMDSGGGVTDSEFESCYRELLQGLSDRNIKAICMAPFFINEKDGDYTGVEFPAKSQIVSDLAAEFHAEFINMKPYMLQAVQDGAYKMELFGDLTHPWAAGCRIITDLVVDKISKLIDSNYHTPANLGEYVPLAMTASDNDEDFTNQRAFLSSSHGRLAYDTEDFYSTVDFTSHKSVKMTNELLNPEASNAYVRTLFDFHEDGKRDLSNGTLKVSIKVDNALPTVSFRAFKALSSSASANVSSSYSVTLGGSSKAVAVGNGWYEVTVDLSSWAHDQTNDALANAIALEIAMSKGENASARNTYSVNGAQNSYMWMDNLRFDLTPTGDHRGVEFVPNYAVSVAPISLNRTINIDFKFTTASDTYLNFMLGDEWNSYYGYYHVNGNGTLGGNYPGVSITTLVDGYYRVTVNISELTNPQGGTPTKIDLFYIHSTWSTAEGYVDFNPSYNPGVVRGSAFSAGSNYAVNVPVSALTETINIDFKFTSGVDTHLNFMVGDGWTKYFGYYRVNANGTLNGNYNGVSISALDDGYYRVTLVLSELDLINAGQDNNAPTEINFFLIRGDWSDASGYVDYNPDVNPGVIRGSAFSAGSNYPVSVPVSALTETINIDFRFTSGVDTHLNFMVGDGWTKFFGYYCVNANGSLGGNYNGVSITFLSDGYFRVTLVLSELDYVNSGQNNNAPTEINFFLIRGDWTTASGYVDYNPTI